MNAELDKNMLHISLDVADLESSMAFYRTLFGVDPVKIRPEYAKFEPAEPAVVLALNLVDVPAKGTGRVSHFGVRVADAEALAAIRSRVEGAGIATTIEDQVTCCYAVQDKVWVRDPDGNPWEIYQVTQADTEVHSARKGGQAPQFSCCPTDSRADAAKGGGCC